MQLLGSALHWLALSGGFGRFQMGRSLTPSFWGVAAWELTGTANYSAVANQFGFAGGPSRNNSMFMYTTPNMGGFSGTLGYVAKPDNGWQCQG
ncbi:MAG: porin [Giesbergeria sp.]